MDEPASKKQLRFVASLVRNYLDFFTGFYPVGDEEIVDFINEEYGAWLEQPIKQLSDLQSFEASEILSRLAD